MTSLNAKVFKRALINQFLERSGGGIAMEEGCLSLPGIHESVSLENGSCEILG